VLTGGTDRTLIAGSGRLGRTWCPWASVLLGVAAVGFRLSFAGRSSFLRMASLFWLYSLGIMEPLSSGRRAGCGLMTNRTPAYAPPPRHPSPSRVFVARIGDMPWVRPKGWAKVRLPRERGACQLRERLGVVLREQRQTIKWNETCVLTSCGFLSRVRGMSATFRGSAGLRGLARVADSIREPKCN
jgi:hypothetical protein